MRLTATPAFGPRPGGKAGKETRTRGRLAKRSSFHLLGLLLVALSLPAPAGRSAEIAPDPTEVGRKLYQNRCAKCHQMYDPAKYTDTQWQTWMTKMGKKAKLRPAEKQMVLQYVEQSLRASVKTSARVTKARSPGGAEAAGSRIAIEEGQPSPPDWSGHSPGGASLTAPR